MEPAIKTNILLKMNTRQKEKYALTDNIQIEISKGFNFNLREDRSSMGYIINGRGLTKGHQALCHHLTIESGNEVTAETILTDDEKKIGFKVFSVDKDMVFATSPDGIKWFPCKDFLITFRIFKPYKGKLKGIEPSVLKDRMYIIKGVDEFEEEITDLSDKVACTTVNSDYEIIWHNENNREQSLIRTRSREVLAIDNGMLEDLKKGELLMGLSPTNCKTYKEYINGNK